MRRGDLDDLAAFAAVARTRSFTCAAAELGLPPSALSHAMKGLEGRLGVRLLARTTRSVAPTAAGEQLLATLDPALASVESGLGQLAEWRDAPAGALRLTTFGWAARMILSLRLPAFLLAHPAKSIEVAVADELVDLVAGGFDAGIRLAGAVEADMIAVPVSPPLRMVVVAMPAYFVRYPAPTTPADLRGHVCINYRLVGGGLLPWEFENDRRDQRYRVAGQLTVNDEGLVAATARAGAGLGYLMENDVADEVADGRLIQVLDDWRPTYPGCMLYYPDRRVGGAMRILAEALRWRPA